MCEVINFWQTFLVLAFIIVTVTKAQQQQSDYHVLQQHTKHNQNNNDNAYSYHMQTFPTAYQQQFNNNPMNLFAYTQSPKNFYPQTSISSNSRNSATQYWSGRPIIVPEIATDYIDNTLHAASTASNIIPTTYRPYTGISYNKNRNFVPAPHTQRTFHELNNLNAFANYPVFSAIPSNHKLTPLDYNLDQVPPATAYNTDRTDFYATNEQELNGDNNRLPQRLPLTSHNVTPFRVDFNEHFKNYVQKYPERLKPVYNYS